MLKSFRIKYTQTFLSVVFAVLFFCNILFAADSQSVRYSLELNRIGAGVSANAMGNAFTAAQPEAVHIYWNCANLANLSNRQLYFSHTGLYGNIATYNSFILALPLYSGVSIGAGYLRYEDADIPRFNSLAGTQSDRENSLNARPDGTYEETFSSVQDEILVSTAKQYLIDLPRVAFYSIPAPLSISLGGTFKFYRNVLDQYYGLNANMDAGIIAQLGLEVNPKTRFIERMICVGASLQDILGTPVSWQYSDYREETQYNYRVGISYIERTPIMHGQLQICADVEKQYDRIDHVGIEYFLFNVFAIRAGLNNRYPTVGAGVKYNYFRIDYAYSFYSLADTPFQLGLQIAF